MTESLKGFASPGRQYLIITISYWLFTITDGALRMLIVLHFHNLGYSTLQIAFLFLFYEAFGVVTNIIGVYLGARFATNCITIAMPGLLNPMLNTYADIRVYYTN